MAPEPVRIAFDALAALVLAYLTGWAANDVVRIAVDRTRRRRMRLFVWVLTLFVETVGIVLFTVLTLAAAAQPPELSAFNQIVYWLAFIIELLAITIAVLRGYRATRRASDDRGNIG